ncbi:TRAP-type mannitol/chloroaromatic compound transport system substrate-binding protein [Hoeflea halophila]|uniref:TRAP-type mannitol/chloroaromatic compound transport system substrate-binding protein n=1 Tax=Hoeflea halophila TaxID=714899 RepID=A0A286I8V2_9HYPH|nr:TRAP transporter substrate-binding protein [Hoeflea halophila]SOE16563.1 TRAP-type mannitol/chloroaromatic compound transport system substrate-binding protein [Hoeflea halophila]
MRKTIGAATMAVAMMTAAPATAESFDLQSVFGLQVPSIGPSPVKWAERVKLMTGGDIDIKVHGAGDFVPPFEVFGAVSSGALPMGFDWIGYWASTIPVANLIGSMPFGPTPDVALAWMFEGGGMEIIQKAYDPHGVKVIPCHLVVPEAGGWFNKEINSVDDFKGLNMRIAGLGGKTLARLGANTQLVPAGEIYVSLETGRIDATEFSAPQLDLGFGFQKVVKNYYFPGWHQPSSWDSIIINMDVWNGFSEDVQNIMVEACKANIAFNLGDQLHAQADAIAAIREAGVEIRRFPDEVLADIRTEAEKVLTEEAANDPIFKEAYESLTAYMDRVGEWERLQAIPAK